MKNKLTFKILFLILMTDVVESVAELFFKKAALATGIADVNIHNLGIFALKIISSPAMWSGAFVYFINFLMWIVVLSRLDLSVAFPIGATTYIFVPLLSMLFLHEKVMAGRWVGIGFIIIGILLVSQSTHAKEAHA